MLSNNNATATNVEVPLQVTTKDLKKVAAGKKLVEWNRQKNKLVQEAKTQPDESQKSNLSYGI